MSSEDLDDADDVRTFGGGASPDAWQKLRDEGFTDRTAKATYSQQHDTTDDDTSNVKWYDPPYPPKHLALLKERSETHVACIHAKAQGVAGYGFDLVPHQSAEADDPPGKDALADFWFGADSRWQLCPDEQSATSAEVLEQAWDDYESVGWLTIEVLRNETNMAPTGGAHVPAHTIRKRKDGPGWVQIDPDTSVIESYFAPAEAAYGDEKLFVDADTGDIGSSVSARLIR